MQKVIPKTPPTDNRTSPMGKMTRRKIQAIPHPDIQFSNKFCTRCPRDRSSIEFSDWRNVGRQQQHRNKEMIVVIIERGPSTRISRKADALAVLLTHSEGSIASFICKLEQPEPVHH